jgi:septal ring factor EnvC (AmiA/AmiB activator)
MCARFTKTVVTFFLLAPVLSGTLFSQATRSDQQKELRRLRKEIERYRNQILQQEDEEFELLDMLASLDKEIDLTRGVLYSLREDEKETRRNIRKLEGQLAETQDELSRLKSHFARRLVSFYKHGRTKDLELLLSAHSFTQAQVWLRYQKLVTDSDRRSVENILEKKRRIDKQRTLLKTELATSERIMKEKQGEESNLRNSRKERGEILEKVRQDKRSLERRLAEYQEAARRIEDFIQQAEEERLATTQEEPRRVEYVDLASRRGKILWPTRGEIVGQYGKEKHPQLGTVTQNIGIDIRATEGTPVNCVAPGTVSVITWQRGGGNIVIIAHGGGFYTVYSHLAEIYVTLHEQLEERQTIGTVGDTGSLKGPILHFEVWKSTRHLNPIEWLEPAS